MGDCLQSFEFRGRGAEVGGVFGDDSLGGVVVAVGLVGSEFEGEFEIWAEAGADVFEDLA